MRKTAATTAAKLTTPFFYVEMALGISLKAIFLG